MKGTWTRAGIPIACLAVMLAFTGADRLDGADAGFKVVKGEGSICAAGIGIIQFHGSGELVATLDAGQLIVNDEAVVVEIEGKGLKHLFANGWVLYEGMSGKVHLSGENLFGQIAGKGVRIAARGEGVMLLTGRGAYRSPCEDPAVPWASFGPAGVAVDLGDYIVDSQ